MKLLWICVLFALPFIPQDSTFKLENSIPVESDYIASDNTAFLYAIQNDTLWKYDSDGDKITYYYEEFGGDIYSIDVTNPYHVMLFYKDNAQITFLNQDLKQEGFKLNLQDIGMDRATIACSSFENGMWVFNPVSNKLYRYNNQNNLVSTSEDLSKIITLNINPEFMAEVDNTLYVTDPDVGIMVFTNTGTYVKTYNLTGIDSFQVVGGNIYYQSGQNFNAYNIISGTNSLFSLPGLSANQISVSLAADTWRLFVREDESIDIYSINMDLFK